MGKLLSRLGINGFIYALGAMIVLAYFVPGPGMMSGPFALKNLGDYGISLIFFFYGLGLSPKKFLADVANWKLQVLVIASTFVIFPLLVLSFYLIFSMMSEIGNKTLWIGIFYLAVLPSTVSSSVVMVSIARGNLAAAIFCSAISSVLGIFITPLWMNAFLSMETGGLDLLPIFRDLAIQILCPLAAGMILHPRFGTWAQNRKNSLRKFDQSVVLLIVYTSFCDSFQGKAFSGFGFSRFFGLGIAMIFLFFIVYGIVFLLSRILRFQRADTITALFCGSKKSLMHATAIGKILFASSPYSLGIVLLPTMMYHALQLVIASVIANRFRNENPD